VADKENPQALYQLAILYEQGLPPAVYPDENYALSLLMEAAELGYAPAEVIFFFLDLVIDPSSIYR